MGREPESTAVKLRKVAIHLQCSLTLDLARNRNLLRQLASRIKIMIKIKKLANSLNSMVVESRKQGTEFGKRHPKKPAQIYKNL